MSIAKSENKMYIEYTFYLKNVKTHDQHSKKVDNGNMKINLLFLLPAILLCSCGGSK